MIISKQDLKEYMQQDKKQLGIRRRFPRPFTDEIWKYEITLRKYEYWYNQSRWGSGLMRFLYKVKHHRNSVKLGIGIGPNCCGKGLSIAHIGTIQINDHARIGENLRIQEGVNIGAGPGGCQPSEIMFF